MISFQRLLGREAEFFGLLEGSAQQAVASVAALKAITENPAATSLAEVAAARRKNKELIEKVELMLINIFVTPMEREDIEELAESLYRIPKVIEKFAERYLLAPGHTRDTSFSGQITLLEKSVSLVLDMVRALRASDLAKIKTDLNALQQIEADADAVLTASMAQLYTPDFPPLKAIILADLYALLEKAVDRCRDCGSVISHTYLKNS